MNEDDKLLCLERELRTEGFSFIAGVDEAGRGPLAGPVAAAAVCFPPGARIPRVFDSKQLSEAERLEMREAIMAVPGVQFAVVFGSVEDIDRWNILQTNDRAMYAAVKQLERVDFLLIDGRPVPHMPYPSRAVVGGDAKSASIAAASILAKTARDEAMMELDKLYPEYGFAEHKGYGTAAHLEALRKFGPCPAHRKSFSPIKEMLSPYEQKELF
ncbi:MAG: ribonuclease HII [Lentisphaeria bacterium]|nr:ribonuclease HII [Lentisphaeria bacterium]